MGNNKGQGIFLGVIGVATLLVAIIGATFAFFGANIASPEGALTTTAAKLSLGFANDTGKLKFNLIPAEYWIAEYAATNETYMGVDKAKQCIDENNNEICSVYTFTIGNPSRTTAQNLFGEVIITENGFADLHFTIYDELGEQVVKETKLPKSGTVSLSDLEQKLLPSSSDVGKTDEADAKDTFDATNPTTYTSINDMTLETNKGKENNVRTYTMVLWIEETMTDQTEANAGATFVGGVKFTTANDETGVTGIIGTAQKPTGKHDNPDGTDYETDEEPTGGEEQQNP